METFLPLIRTIEELMESLEEIRLPHETAVESWTRFARTHLPKHIWVCPEGDRFPIGLMLQAQRGRRRFRATITSKGVTFGGREYKTFRMAATAALRSAELDVTTPSGRQFWRVTLSTSSISIQEYLERRKQAASKEIA